MRLIFDGLDAEHRELLRGLAQRADERGAHAAAACLRGVEMGEELLDDAGVHLVQAAWALARHARQVLDGASPWGDVVCAAPEQAQEAAATVEQALSLLMLAETLLGDEEGEEGGGEPLPVVEEPAAPQLYVEVSP